ncbi:CHAT domain-containing protein [Promicromonospora sp. NFX87]|uniref:CHAT domain-containing protein n=1 Tax=Promicromonospora sp. NFX87 TaxID=3402691 RepID=UPI003AFA6251
MNKSTWNVSTFDPFGPVSDQELRDWLVHRYELPDDEVVLERAAPWGVLFTTGVGIGGRLRGLRWLVSSAHLTRVGRSRDGQIGLYECDLSTLLDRTVLWPALVVRLAAVALAVLAGLFVAAPGLVVALLGLTTWTMIAWRARFAFPLLGVALALVAWIELPLVLLFVPMTLLLVQLRVSVPFLTTGLLTRKVLSSPLRFLGWGFLFRALWDSTASSIVLAVDKATHDDRARAGVFIDAALGRVPAHLHAVLVQCQALAALGRLEFQSALKLSEDARALASDAPVEIAGWCALQSGDVLLAAGQLHAAESRWKEAAEKLDGTQRGRYWATQAHLRLIEAQTADLTDTGRCLTGLQTLYQVRVAAIRDGDLPLLDRTEMHLLRLMNEAGNPEGVVVYLWRQNEYGTGRIQIGERTAEYVKQKLLFATMLLDILDNPSSYPETAVEGDEGRRELYYKAATLMDHVLSHLSRTTEPVLRAEAYAILARVQAATELHDDALGNALESLNVVQRVRYQLPTSQWRAAWVAAHADTYALTLDLAATRGKDPALVAELLEAIRAQAIPVEAGLEGNHLRSVFDSIVSSTGVPAAADLPEKVKTDPVATDPLLTDSTILVQRASWIGGAPTTALDLDAELMAMVPSGWYWSFARVGEWIYHTVRSPEGTWSADRQPYAPFAEPFHDLVRLLPVDLPDTEPATIRIKDTALVAEHGHDRVDNGSTTAAQVFARIVDSLGSTLVPAVLATALTTGGPPVLLAVAPTASLMTVPIWALRIDQTHRVADVAAVSHIPSIALLAQRRRLAVAQDRGPRVSSDHVLAILAPHEDPEDPYGFVRDLPHAATTVPPRSQEVNGPLPKSRLAALLAPSRVQDGVLFLAGHVDPPPKGEPGRAGFQLANQELFGLRDFYRTDDDGAPVYRVPQRVVLAGCASLGVHSSPTKNHAWSLVDAPEWLGLGAAMVYGGAHHVYCTLFPVVDTEHTKRIDLALVEAMRHNTDPAWALRAVQRAELKRWERGQGSIPAAFLAYAYVGLGAAPTHGLDATMNMSDQEEPL